MKVYDERQFHELLALERRRSECSGDPLHLLLVEAPAAERLRGRLTADLARGIFATLSECLREVDFIGWFEEPRVIGAVLTHSSRPSADAARRIGYRVSDALFVRFPARAGHLAVRLVPLTTRPGHSHAGHYNEHGSAHGRSSA